MSSKKLSESSESDEDYVPPTKRSKSTNSQSSDQEQEPVQKDNQYKPPDKLDALWQEFKNDTTSLCSQTVRTKETKAELETNVKDNLARAEITPECKKELELPPTGEKGCIVVSGAPGKSRLNQLLTTRAMKKRQKPENILNSSKRDWESLKLREDLSEELVYHNKDGFIQRQDFLKRCEEREHDEFLEAKKRKRC